MPLPPPLVITSAEKAVSDAARAEINAMFLSGTLGGGVIPAPFLGLESLPSIALDLQQDLVLGVIRRMAAFQAFNNVTAAYPHTSAPFTAKGGTLLVLVSASAFPTVSGGLFGFDIKIDAATVGVLEQYGNETEHYMLCRPLLVSGIAPGSRTLGLSLRANTSVDSGDRLSASVIELPF